MPATGCAFIIALLLAISVPASGVTAPGKADTPQTPAQEGQQGLRHPLEGTPSVMTGCQLSCKNRYIKEVEKCRQLTPTTFKRRQCIKEANYFGQTCENFCRSKFEDIPSLE